MGSAHDTCLGDLTLIRLQMLSKCTGNFKKSGESNAGPMPSGPQGTGPFPRVVLFELHPKQALGGAFNHLFVAGLENSRAAIVEYRFKLSW
jgi:hypothetical protein